MDITYDELDAVLRDPQAPGDVRAAVQTEIAVRNYLARVDFHTTDEGVAYVSYKEAPVPVTEVPSSDQTQAGTITPASTPTPTAERAPDSPAPDVSVPETVPPPATGDPSAAVTDTSQTEVPPPGSPGTPDTSEVDALRARIAELEAGNAGTSDVAPEPAQPPVTEIPPAA